MYFCCVRQPALTKQGEVVFQIRDRVSLLISWQPQFELFVFVSTHNLKFLTSYEYLQNVIFLMFAIKRPMFNAVFVPNKVANNSSSKIKMEKEEEKTIESTSVNRPEHYRRAQTGEQLAALNFWVLQSTLFQTSEQGKASYTPA